MNLRDSFCRNCEASTAGDCGRHGPEFVRVGEVVGQPAPPHERALVVLSHPRFFRIERVHAGHTGDCPQEAWAGLPCWHWDVGVGLTEGRVTWWDGSTWQEAIGKAADAIEGRKREAF